MNELNVALSIKEANLILKALGNMPYYQVHELIAKIHQQAQLQITNEVLTETEKKK